MKMIIKIELDNDAFVCDQDAEIPAACGNEIARQLRDLALRVEQESEVYDDFETIVRDYNGNTTLTAFIQE